MRIRVRGMLLGSSCDGLGHLVIGAVNVSLNHKNEDNEC